MKIATILLSKTVQLCTLDLLSPRVPNKQHQHQQNHCLCLLGGKTKLGSFLTLSSCCNIKISNEKSYLKFATYPCNQNYFTNCRLTEYIFYPTIDPIKKISVQIYAILIWSILIGRLIILAKTSIKLSWKLSL